jgi:uncharacterized membrane protein
MVSCPQGDTKTRRNKMTILANIVIAVVAVLHVGFLLLEMFFWDHPFGRKRFGMTPEYSQASASLAANQGLYNGFLAAGLIWDWPRASFRSSYFSWSA